MFILQEILLILFTFRQPLGVLWDRSLESVLTRSLEC